MKWSWKLAHVAGIGVYMHATFLLLIGSVALRHWRAGQSLATVLAGIAFILALFGCVVLHEFGHAITARKYGIKTRDITLLPIGGVARLERMPEDPKQELWVALAGPAVKRRGRCIALRLDGSDHCPGTPQPRESHKWSLPRTPDVRQRLSSRIQSTAGVPMDGGRVLRALLATRMEHAQHRLPH